MKVTVMSPKSSSLSKSAARQGDGSPSAYKPPRLERIVDAEALLEILGPAQAFYRGAGFNNP